MVRRFFWALTARFTRAMGCSYLVGKWLFRRLCCAAGQPFSSFLTRLVSLADTVVRPSSRRVRVLGLCSSRWRRLAFWRTILPVPVRRNRFDAPLWVLVLGMCPQFCGVSWATVRRRYSVVRPEAWDQWPVPPRGHGSSRRGAVP